MKFKFLPFGLLNLAVFASLASANPVEVLQFIGQPAAPGAVFHKGGGEVEQFIDFGFNHQINHPFHIADDEEYIDQDGPEEGEVFADEDGDVLQFIGLGGGHEDVVFVNDDGQVKVEEFYADAAMARTPDYPRASSPSVPESSPNFSKDFGRDSTPEVNSTDVNFTRDFTPEVNSTLANNSTQENFSRGFTPEVNSTDVNFTRDFTRENNSTLANNSTESSFTHDYLNRNSTALPDEDEEEEGGGLLDGILNFFENLFRF